MYYNWFQGGDSLELFNPSKKDLNWSYTGSNKREYDKTSKSHVLYLNIGGLSKLSLPKNEKKKLEIAQGFMVFQLYLFSMKNFTIEIAISDTENVKHRLIFSTQLREFSMNYFTCLVPLFDFFPVGVWCNLSIDVLSFVSFCYNGLVFKSIDGITVSASCKIRRIFTMRSRLKDEDSNSSISLLDKSDLTIKTNGISIHNNYEPDDIPKKFMIPLKDIKVLNINLNFEKIWALVSYSAKDNVYKPIYNAKQDFSLREKPRSISKKNDISIITTRPSHYSKSPTTHNELFYDMGKRGLENLRRKARMIPNQPKAKNNLSLFLKNERPQGSPNKNKQYNISVLKKSPSTSKADISSSTSKERYKEETIKKDTQKLKKQLNTLLYSDEKGLEKTLEKNIERSKIIKSISSVQEMLTSVKVSEGQFFVDENGVDLPNPSAKDRIYLESNSIMLKVNPKKNSLQESVKLTSSIDSSTILKKNTKERPYSPPINNFSVDKSTKKNN